MGVEIAEKVKNSHFVVSTVAYRKQHGQERYMQCSHFNANPSSAIPFIFTVNAIEGNFFSEIIYKDLDAFVPFKWQQIAERETRNRLSFYNSSSQLDHVINRNSPQ